MVILFSPCRKPYTITLPLQQGHTSSGYEITEDQSESSASALRHATKPVNVEDYKTSQHLRTKKRVYEHISSDVNISDVVINDIT